MQNFNKHAERKSKTMPYTYNKIYLNDAKPRLSYFLTMQYIKAPLLCALKNLLFYDKIY